MTDKLWRIPHPWNYHKQAAIVVMAASKEEAVMKVKSRIEEYFNTEDILWNEIKEVGGGVYNDCGCDC